MTPFLSRWGIVHPQTIQNNSPPSHIFRETDVWNNGFGDFQSQSREMQFENKKKKINRLYIFRVSNIAPKVNDIV